MAELRKIEYPRDIEYLNRPTLSEQEIANMSEIQRPLAKDWNVINNKMNWLIQETVTMHNILVEHDLLLDRFKKFLWLSGWLAGSTGGIGGLVYIILKMSRDVT